MLIHFLITAIRYNFRKIKRTDVEKNSKNNDFGYQYTLFTTPWGQQELT